MAPFSQEEVKLLLNNAEGFFLNYLAIAFMTGMRPGEILALTINDIDLENKIIVLIELKANLKFDKFKKALRQLMSSYLKTMAILNLIENFIDFKALLLIASRETQFDSFSNENDIRLVNKKQDTLFSPVNPELFGYFATLCKEAELRLKKFPFHAPGLGRKFIINENLIKENVPLLFFRCEEIIDISHLIARTTNG